MLFRSQCQSPQRSHRHQKVLIEHLTVADTFSGFFQNVVANNQIILRLSPPHRIAALTFDCTIKKPALSEKRAGQTQKKQLPLIFLSYLHCSPFQICGRQIRFPIYPEELTVFCHSWPASRHFFHVLGMPASENPFYHFILYEVPASVKLKLFFQNNTTRHRFIQEKS